MKPFMQSALAAVFLLVAASLTRAAPAHADFAGIAPLSPIERFNFVAGTQSIGAGYQFTSEPLLVETARAMLAGIARLSFTGRCMTTRKQVSG